MELFDRAWVEAYWINTSPQGALVGLDGLRVGLGEVDVKSFGRRSMDADHAVFSSICLVRPLAISTGWTLLSEGAAETPRTRAPSASQPTAGTQKTYPPNLDPRYFTTP